jgi:hypothetical protein
MDKETRAEFDRQQAKREQPECFGNWESSAKCSHCWFHPDCKEVKPQTFVNDNVSFESIKEDPKLSRPEIMKMLDELEIEYDKRGKKADLEIILNEAMK